MCISFSACVCVCLLVLDAKGLDQKQFERMYCFYLKLVFFRFDVALNLAEVHN